MTDIEWTKRDGTKGETWNAVTGCDKISPGCGLPRFEGDLNGGCYALAMARRLKAMGSAKYQTDGDPRTSGPGFGLTVHPDALDIPLRWKRPRTVFVNSMSDLFHARVPRSFIAQVWHTMAVTPQHTYQILTKRPERMRRIVGDEFDGGQALLETLHDEQAALRLYEAPWPLPNCWLGTSVELADYARRIDHLRETAAAVRFLSLEPLLGPLPNLDLTGISWAIIGGESGPAARPMDLGWVRDIIAQCRAAGVAVFVKQMGSRYNHGHHHDPAVWPEDLRIREYPQPAAVPA